VEHTSIGRAWDLRWVLEHASVSHARGLWWVKDSTSIGSVELGFECIKDNASIDRVELGFECVMDSNFCRPCLVRPKQLPSSPMLIFIGFYLHFVCVGFLVIDNARILV
jgi:hypothetical protein